METQGFEFPFSSSSSSRVFNSVSSPYYHLAIQINQFLTFNTNHRKISRLSKMYRPTPPRRPCNTDRDRFCRLEPEKVNFDMGLDTLHVVACSMSGITASRSKRKMSLLWCLNRSKPSAHDSGQWERSIESMTKTASLSNVDQVSWVLEKRAEWKARCSWSWFICGIEWCVRDTWVKISDQCESLASV